MLLPLVLLAALVAFRAVGALGVRRFASWRVSAAHALAVVLVVTASAHFVPPSVTVMPNSAELVAMVPPQVPFPEAMVYLTGVLELAAAAGLVMPRTRRLAALGLVVLLLLMFPANVHAALNGVEMGGAAPTPLLQRTLEQVLYVGVAAWLALRTGGDRPSSVGREPSDTGHARSAAVPT